MIRVERSAIWWAEIAADPAVAAANGRAYSAEEIALVMAMPTVTPLADEHGGFWFVALDSFARVFEMHTMFTPAGWGREVHGAAKEAFHRMFSGTCEIITTYQIEANQRSQPPRSFGFKPVGGVAPSPMGPARTWMLTSDAWLTSPGGRSQCQ